MSKTQVVLIWAEDRDGGIGFGKLPWDIPEDLEFFKKVTQGNVVVMGRKTFESLPIRPLPNRRTIVVTRQSDYGAHGADVAGSVKEALELATDAEFVYIAGGAEIYHDALPYATQALVTEIDLQVEADTFAPDLLEEDGWELAQSSEPLPGSWSISRKTGTLYRVRFYDKIKQKPLAKAGVFCYTWTMGVFSRYAQAYTQAGFIPMPWVIVNGSKKMPAVKGYLNPNPPVGDWVKAKPNAQVGIVADGWLGIDVDSAEHEGKAGEETIRSLQSTLGKLPKTVSSTARGADSVSRIYFYRVPKENRRYRDVGKDVESIRPGHRFAAVFPSMHPSGNQYKWYNAQGAELDDIPSIYEFAQLPELWLEYLTATAVAQKFYSGSIPLWKSKLVEGDMSEEVQMKLLETERSFGHTDLVRILSWLADRGAKGEPGIAEAFEVVRKNFTRDEWNQPEYHNEFEQAYEWAIRNAGGEEEESPEETFTDVVTRWEELSNPTLTFDKGDLAMSLKMYCESLTSDFSDETVTLYKKCLTLLERVETEQDAENWITKTKEAMRRVING